MVQARVELQAQTAHGPDALPLYDFGPPGDEQRSRPRTSEPDMLSSATFLKRARRAVEHPFTVLRSATIPDPDGGWTFHDRIQICASPVVIVVLSTLAFANTSVLGMSPWALAVAVFGSAALSRLTYRPKALVASFGFVSSIAWLSLLAAELVGVVQAMGIIANLSTSTLGLTVLAIANSAGDIVTNVTIATHTANGPASAISACFGAPIMSDLLGLGISLTTACATAYPADVTFKVDHHVTIGWAFLLGVLLVNMVAFPMYDFEPPPRYGCALIAIYLAFLLVSVPQRSGYLWTCLDAGT